MDSCRNQQRPPYPVLTMSMSSSAFQNSNKSIDSATSASSHVSSSNMAISPSRHQGQYNAAPLPSPTLDEQSYLGSMSHQTGSQQLGTVVRHQQNQQQIAAQQMAAIQHYQQQQQQQQQQAYFSQQQYAQDHYAYQSDRQRSGTSAQETNAYINNYALLAEAAKRAQMAVLERDLGGVDLG